MEEWRRYAERVETIRLWSLSKHGDALEQMPGQRQRGTLFLTRILAKAHRMVEISSTCKIMQKAFITLCSPVVPLLSTSKADSGLASEFRWDLAVYTAYERMLKVDRQSRR